MKIVCSTFDEMERYIITENKRIVMIGLGVIGRVIVPQILKKVHLDDRVDFCLDNDARKWGMNFFIGKRNICIQSIENIDKIETDKVVILLNISRFSEVLHQLEQYKQLESVCCYITPMLCIHNFKNNDYSVSIHDFDTPQIPKVIHYMWLGKKELPKFLIDCMDSWKKFCPEYEIVQWNETNYNVNKHPYMERAYAQKAYGFVPDYARLDILYHYGGFYLDTDVQLIKSLNDLRYQEAFCGVEKWQTLNFGGGSGAVKGNADVLKFLKAREKIRFLNSDGTENRTTCGYYDTLTAIKYGYQINGQIQKIGSMNIYPSEYFHPYDYMSGHVEITTNTFSIHRFNGGWLSPEMKLSNIKAVEKFNILYRESLEECSHNNA